ncbi:MAG: anaerobic glycerol-3-phosphate dehydrogenase subunit C [Planctomycetes bacterium]|nr:anaerobic glycerol-3-phosphate dehydrogenase subunit C [Planctomycetota bacterium]
MNDIEHDLRALVEGEVRFDDYTRTLYSTDASIYDITPIGVVFPRSETDAVRVVQYAHERGIPVLPRGSGSSLSGQAVGQAIILDFTRHLHALVEVRPEEKWARVQPGLIYDELNLALRPHGLHFGPDPASGDRAAMGGMIGNNSTGAHSLLYGMTSDHVKSLRVLLSNGQVATFEPVARGGPEFERAAAAPGLAGEITRGMDRLRREYDFECGHRYPPMRRNVAGYNLREVTAGGVFNLCPLVCGSEGTLVTVLEAKLGLVDRPRATGMIVLCFRDLIEALRAVVPLLEHRPSALEVVDDMLLDLARRNREHGGTARSLPEGTRATLLVEFYGQDADDLRPRIEEVRRLAADEMGLAFHTLVALEPGRQRALWNLRKAGLAILMSKPGDAKPTAFVEDTAVPPDRLPEYIAEFLAIVKRHGTEAAVYAHAGAGCLHIRPVINLKDPAEVERMYEIADQISDLVIRYGGTTSSEHGDGLVRTQWLQKLYGPRLTEAFARIKRLFDPKGIMNPGKIVGPATDLRQHLRYRQVEPAPPVRTALNFSSQVDFIRSVEMCNGCGGCRDRVEGVMCPSFRGANEEITSTRGRANLMRQALSGKLPGSELTSRRFKEAVLDLCLGCKACKRECPSGVDLAKLKAEIKYQYIQEHGASMADLFFGHIDAWSVFGSALAPLANAFNGSFLGRLALEKFVGLDPRRQLPRFRWRTFIRWFQHRTRRPAASARGRIAFFADCFVNHHAPEVGQAAVSVLEALGYEVVLADRQCCGRATLSAGLIDDAREKAAYNVRRLAEQIRAGYEIVGCEPSCMVTLQDDYRDLLDSPDLALVESHSFEWAEFLNLHAPKEGLAAPGRKLDGPLLYHGHCHQKATGRAHHAPEVLRTLAGADVQVIASGCCGMAGAFGYEKTHYDLSMSIGELLFQQLRNRPGRIMASGASCRSQIEHGLGVKTFHPAELLAESMRPE